MNRAELRTDRTLMRPVDTEDATILHRHWNRPEVGEYLWDGNEVSMSIIEDLVEESPEQFADLGCGLWRVDHAQAGLFVGVVGFWYFHEPPRLELVISLEPRWWGIGLADEIVERVIRFGFEECRMDRIVASTDSPNLKSQHLAERLGFERVERREGDEEGLVVYEMGRG